jgi:ADP-glucose pyrophosphorylase
MRSARPELLAFVMAGGEGTRLHPLTADRCKPAVPFNDKHRIVDFVLSNLTLGGKPGLRIANSEWPIYARRDTAEPAQIDSGVIRDSVIANGCYVSGARMRRRDAERFHVSETGIVVVPRGYFPSHR